MYLLSLPARSPNPESVQGLKPGTHPCRSQLLQGQSPLLSHIAFQLFCDEWG